MAGNWRPPPPGCWPFCYPTYACQLQFFHRGPDPFIVAPSFYMRSPGGVTAVTDVDHESTSFCDRQILLIWGIGCSGGTGETCGRNMFVPQFGTDHGSYLNNGFCSWFGLSCGGAPYGGLEHASNGPFLPSFSGGEFQMAGPFYPGTYVDDGTCGGPPFTYTYDWGMLNNKMCLFVSTGVQDGPLFFDSGANVVYLTASCLAVYAMDASAFNPTGENTFAAIWSRPSGSATSGNFFLTGPSAGTYSGDANWYHINGSFAGSIIVKPSHWNPCIPPLENLTGIPLVGSVYCSPEIPYFAFVTFDINITDTGSGDCNITDVYDPTLCYEVSTETWVTGVDDSNLSCYLDAVGFRNMVLDTGVAGGVTFITSVDELAAPFLTAELTRDGLLTVNFYLLDYTVIGPNLADYTPSALLYCTVSTTIDMRDTDTRCSCVGIIGPVAAFTFSCTGDCSGTITTGGDGFCFSGGKLLVDAGPGAGDYSVYPVVLRQVGLSTMWTGEGTANKFNIVSYPTPYTTAVTFDSSTGDVTCTITDVSSSLSTEIMNGATPIPITGSSCYYKYAEQSFPAQPGSNFFSNTAAVILTFAAGVNRLSPPGFSYICAFCGPSTP